MSLMDTCEIRVAVRMHAHGRPLLRVNGMPSSVAHAIEAAPRYAQNHQRMPVVVTLNGVVIYAHTPLNTPRWAQGISIKARRERRGIRGREAAQLRALTSLQED